jgi:hypothetical protein
VGGGPGWRGVSRAEQGLWHCGSRRTHSSQRKWRRDEQPCSMGRSQHSALWPELQGRDWVLSAVAKCLVAEPTGDTVLNPLPETIYCLSRHGCGPRKSGTALLSFQRLGAWQVPCPTKSVSSCGVALTHYHHNPLLLSWDHCARTQPETLPADIHALLLCGCHRPGFS